MISVIIPTHSRASLLEASLTSLAEQSLPREHFEVVVVDDGSADATRQVCAKLALKLDLRYFFIANSGISAAKNLGVFASRHPLLFFFDDDDVADRDLLQEHLRAHARHPEENIAILGHTTWALSLAVTEVMHYVTDVDGFLFSYGNLKHGQVLDFTYFWGGRSSCKRSLLVRHGVFDQQFRFSPEDIELGYRLSKHGLKVIYNRRAKQYMNRSITFEEFCGRCERQGNSLYLFSRVHSADVIQRLCDCANAQDHWKRVRDLIGAGFYRVREIEALLDVVQNPPNRPALLSELHRLYAWVFNGFKLRGMSAAEDACSVPATMRSTTSPIVEPVVIYQMGKVGSKTIEASLRACGYPAPICHSHVMHGLDGIEAKTRKSRVGACETLNEITHGRQLVKTLCGSKYIRSRIISLVRDPIARNISAFFQNITEFIPDVFASVASLQLSVKDIVGVFVERYEHDRPATWFQKQLEPVFGIDVLAQPFPHPRGYTIYESTNVSLLIIKLERLNECAEEAMREYLGIEEFKLTTTNMGDAKEYKELYKAFVREARFSEKFLDKIYGSQMSRHFYRDSEIEQFKARWSQAKVCIPSDGTEDGIATVTS